VRLALAFVLGVLSWPRPAAAAPQPERAWEHARTLVRDIGPRPAGSPQALAAAQYVAEHFEAAGVPTERVPVGTQRVPEIMLGALRVSAARTVVLDDESIVATIDATGGAGGPAILVMAHVDTVPGSPGAIDNAAAVGVLLELGRALALEPVRPHDVILVATAGEEPGLVGARAVAAHLEPGRVGVAIALDLVGRRGPLTLNGLSSLLGRDWLERIATAGQTAAAAIDAPLTHQVVSRFAPQLERSDHGVFTALGVPAFHLYHRGPGRIYLQYHRPQDDLEQIDPAATAATLAWLHAFVLDPDPLPPSSVPPNAPIAATWLPVGDGWIVRDASLSALALVLAALCALGVYRSATLGGSATPSDTRWRARVIASSTALGVALLAWLVLLALDATPARMGAHAQPWIHAPGRWILATVLVLAALLVVGAAGLRRWPELARSAGTPAIVLAAAPGLALWWLGIVALAWIPLLQAAALASIGWARGPRTRALVLGFALVPAWACTDPALLREASFHGFLAGDVALAAVLVLPWLPASIAAVRMLAVVRLPVRTRFGILAVAITGWLAVVIGSALGDRVCPGSAFRSDGLACELAFEQPASP